MRLIVTGWRGAKAEYHGDIIAEALADAAEMHFAEARGPLPVTLVHGKCPYGGVDLIAANLAAGWGWTVEEHPPEIRDGRILGPARNRHMCSLGADLVIAFPGPGSRGTWDALRWATRYGIPFCGVPLQLSTRRKAPSPGELWQQAGGDRDHYRQLMREHGHLVPGKPEPLPCGWPDNRSAS